MNDSSQRVLRAAAMQAVILSGILLVSGSCGRRAGDEIVGRDAEQAVDGAMVHLWDTVTLDFDGPMGSEADPATFLDHCLSVTFTHAEQTFVVPGFFAADGQAARSHAISGNQWRVRFTPNAIGNWTYSASMVTGPRVAINDESGTEVALAKASGRFTVVPSRVSTADRDVRGRGRLAYVGKHHLRFEGSGAYFIKGGAGSPENLLGYYGFDGTFDAGGNRYPSLGEDQLHHFAPHAQDYRSGDPNWKDEDGDAGKNIIGFVNYLASVGLNSQYFITMNYEGDGWEVWPWTHFDQRETFDVSRLAQWEILFTHMQRQGILLHVLLTETENESLFEILDGGDFAHTRQLYYREMVARFGHHLALIWNLGEENGHTDDKRRFGAATSAEQMKAFAAYIRALDPYDHPIVVHHFPFEQDKVYGPLLGDQNFEGASLQLDQPYLDKHSWDFNEEVRRWVTASAEHGRRWMVNVDEPLGWEFGLVTDDNPGGGVSQEEARKELLWGTYMAGGAGVEWYFGWKDNSPTSDLGVEDMRQRANMWRVTRIATRFFEEHVPFERMVAANDLTSAADDYVLADVGRSYLVYLKQGGATELDLRGVEGTFAVQWFNPRTGGALQTASVTAVSGGSSQSLGKPPTDPHLDWVVLVSRR